MKINGFIKTALSAVTLGILLLSFQNCGGNFNSVTGSKQQSSLSDTAKKAPVLNALVGWDKSTSANVVGYRIYLGSSSGNYNKVIDVGPTVNPLLPEYQLVNLDPIANRFAVVKTYDISGLESAASNEIVLSGN